VGPWARGKLAECPHLADIGADLSGDATPIRLDADAQKRIGKPSLARVQVRAIKGNGLVKLDRGVGPVADKPAGRLEPLDALRGIAAMAVSLGHLSGLLTGYAATAYAIGSMTPIAAFWLGDRAVLFFFMLSGFVLAIPLLKGGVSPSSFLVKRILRIYPVYWLATLLGLWVVSQGSLGTAAGSQFDTRLGLNYFFLLGAYTLNGVNPPIWSLVHEIRISLYFPFVMLLMRRVPSRWLLIGAAPIAFAGLLSLPPAGLMGASGGATVWYGYFFLVGACLARHRVLLAWRVARLPRATVVLGLFLCLSAYGMPPTVMSSVWLTAVDFGLIAIGASGFILIALSRPLAGAVLTVKPLLFMGRISYGYYLVHYPLLILFDHYGMGRVSNYVIIPSVIVASLAIAWALNFVVERPAIALGRRLAGAIDRWLVKVRAGQASNSPALAA
jgi:peptidoglycan/LPS O-acetylase OafA/YrhL